MQAAIDATGASIDIQAATPTYCRSVRVTHAVADQTTERTMSPGGVFGQILLLGAAGGLVGGGAHLLSEPCAPAGWVTAPCSEEVRSGSRTAGVVSLVGAGVMASVVAAHAIGSIDTTSTVDAGTLRTPSEWKVCAWAPAPYAKVEVLFPDGRGAAGTTDARGSARLDLASIAPSPALAERAQAIVRIDGRDVGVVSLRETELHPRSIRARDASGPFAAARP